MNERERFDNVSENCQMDGNTYKLENVLQKEKESVDQIKRSQLRTKDQERMGKKRP